MRFRCGFLLLLASCGACAAEPIDMRLSAWTAQALPKVERPTQWREADIDGVPTIEAHAAASASGLTRKIDWPGNTKLKWRWQVSRSVKNGDLRKKSGDDFAARLYVIFDPPDEQLSFTDRAKLAIGRKLFGNSLPRAALCYVWSTKEAVGTIAPNAYTDRVRMIVLDQGDANAGSWREHSRDLAADYRAAFGYSETPRIIGLSLMSDTDNTGDSVTARFAGLVREDAAAGS